MHKRRPRKPTLHDKFDHLFFLLWKRDERINRKLNKMANELDRIESEVSEMGSAVDSATALLAKLAQLIRDNAGDPARLKKIADDLDSKGTALAEAVVANTPSEEPPVE